MAAEYTTVGLTSAEVHQKHEAGQTNFIPSKSSRPVKDILRANIFTVFNAILLSAVTAVLLVGDWRDAVFGLVVVLNAIIGIFSELRAKRVLDSVSVLDAPHSKVWRDGEIRTIESENLVVGDAVQLELGDQVPVDGEVLQSSGLEIDESILTGESEPVAKFSGDSVMAGSAVVAGHSIIIAKKIGADTWAQKVTIQAKRFSLATSEIQQSINKILKWITWVVPLVVALLIWSQLRANPGSWKLAVVYAVAGVVGMIPQGLVLLTSLNFGVGAATLARRGVLVQELPAVEILARVDELCLDKTGTITTGGVQGRKIIWANSDAENGDAVSALRFLTRDDVNATARAARSLLEPGPDYAPTDWEEMPFSSARKWAAAKTSEGRTWVLGAPEIVLSEAEESKCLWAHDAVAARSALGERTLCLAYSDETANLSELPGNLVPEAILVFTEDIRPDASASIEYFREQGVNIRVISGDAPATVGAIASAIGLLSENEEEQDRLIIDARKLPDVDTPDFDEAVKDVRVFGRVSPEQKQGLVRSFQRAGHTVAMTGDGVNDAMALKQADLGIAMGSGAPATKAVSRLVLLNGQFSVLTGVVAEGRRIISNMERVSALFLSKTTYAMLIAVIIAISAWAYPFLPRHLTYVSWFTIGIPGFFLALAPSFRRYRPGFLSRTLSIAVPTGIIMGTAAMTSYLLIGESTAAGRTAATLTLIASGLWLLTLTARPLVPWRVTLIILVASGATIGVLVPFVRAFFALDWPGGQSWIVFLVVCAVACILIEIVFRITKRFRQ